MLAQIEKLSLTEQSELSRNEDTIRRGLNTFVEVGAALLAIRDGRLYRAEFRAFEDYCQERWGITPQHGHRLMTAAATVSNLEPIGSILPATESQARPLTRLEPEQQREAWAIAVSTAPDGRVTASHVERVVQEYIAPKPVPHVSHNSGNNEWYTPAEYIEAARDVLGAIDLDPASSEFANQTVKAKRFYSIDDNGLEQAWRGRVWMNPPYAAGLVDQFASKLRDSVLSGDVSSAIVLVNNATETGWFNTFASVSSAIVFPRTRIRFVSPVGELGAPLQGQAVFYIGNDTESFIDRFGSFGLGVLICADKFNTETGRDN